MTATRRFSFSNDLRLAKVLVVLLLASTLSGCYLMQAARGQMDLMSRAQPIDRLIAEPRTSSSLRDRLKYVVQARQFAVDELGLPDNASYRSYADLRRNFVVWNVFATPEFSVEPRRWCFPIAGCVVYRGYFSEKAASDYALELRMDGYDATVGGVSAYSTLGHFDDPVLNTMMGWTDTQLAGTLFHELAHQVIYLPNDSEFNEAFASVVEEEGLARWLRQRGTPDEIKLWQRQRARDGQIASLLLQTRNELRKLYQSRLAPEAMRWRKHQIFGDLKFKYWQLKQEWGGYSGYDRWFDRRLSNAHLVSIATYRECIPRLQRVLKAQNNDLQQFYDYLREYIAKTETVGPICARADLMP